MIKLTVSGTISKVHDIKEHNGKSGKYFTQTVILHLEGGEFRGRTFSDEYYVINIYSTSGTDSRFIQPDKAKMAIDGKAHTKAEVYMKGERWVNETTKDFMYNHKLNLVEWQP